MKCAIALATAFLAVSPSQGLTQTLDDVQAAEAALAAAEAALIEAWEATPLTFRKTTFTEGEPGGFGKFTPRENALFDAGGDTLIIYTEPVGYGWRENEDGTYTIEFDVALAVMDAEGKIVERQEKFDHIEISAKARNRNFQITLTLGFNHVEPGDYTVEYRVFDKHEGETGVISMPFSVVE